MNRKKKTEMVFLLAESFDTLIQLDFTAAAQQTQINNKHTGRGVISLSLLQLLHMNYGKLHSVWNVVNLGEAAVASLTSQLVPTADRVAQNPTCFWVLLEFTIPRPLRLISTLGRRVSRRQSESWRSKDAFFYVSSPCEKSPFHPGEDDSFLLFFFFWPGGAERSSAASEAG